MDDRTEFLAFHGWAFDRHCWDSWKGTVPGGCKFKSFDRGYFNGVQNVNFSENSSARIIFTHSYGLHMCPPELLGRADLLIIFGGFLTFHPQAARFRRRSRLVLQQMIKQFQDTPGAVLKEFWNNTYHPRPAPDFEPDEFNRGRLLNDLRSLNESKLETGSLKMPGKICILHGSRDGIVPKAKGRELYNKFRDKGSYFEVKEAGHALPFTHMEQSWNFIKPKIREIIDE